ncbi:ClbS/DfsB family four-helix bundle protein [Agrobacterium sp.]|jgi:hypothetical protein|uniref:ClbS/DfsB family four-helix bundle protein n=1 Tax=Agrobacterium sp. TaxID=361 RepID=UPI0028B26813
MAVPQTKVELLNAMESGFVKLLTELASIPETLATTTDMEGHAKGTTMSVKDLVAYLTGWGELVLKWNRLRTAGEEPDFPETGYKWNELGKLAAKFYRDYDSLSYVQLLLRFETTHQELMSLVHSLDDEALYGRPWYGKWSLGRMIQFNTASPYANARSLLRKWKKQTSPRS